MLFIEVTVVSLGVLVLVNSRITAVLVCTPLIKFSKCLFLFSSLSWLYACVAVSFIILLYLFDSVLLVSIGGAAINCLLEPYIIQILNF